MRVMEDLTQKSVRFVAPSLIGGEWRSKRLSSEVLSPYDGRVVSEVHECDLKDVNEAIRAADTARGALAALAPYERAAVLRKVSELLHDRASTIAAALTKETGKTIRDSETELGRAADVFRLCAEEATRIEGRHISLGGSAASAGSTAISLRFPVGVVAGIVPFNAPVNIGAHKIGPAFAAGNPIVMKAPPQAPYTMNLLAQICIDAGFPVGTISLLHGGVEVGSELVKSTGVDFVTFTGSGRAGAAIKAVIGMRGCILELGGLGPTIVHRDANLQKAALMSVQAGFRLAGQSCASVQNLFVHQEVVEELTSEMVARVGKLRLGDPEDRNTDVGPVINKAAADRIVSWIEEARAEGAKVLVGGGKKGNLVEPTLLSDVKSDMKVVCEEVFGPVVVLRPYKDIQIVFDWIQDTGLGLNCGLFTEEHSLAFRALREIPCAALLINGTSTFRPEQIPYGGLRNSGYGRESPHDAILAMTQERFIVFPSA